MEKASNTQSKLAIKHFTDRWEVCVVTAVKPAGFLCQTALESICLWWTHTPRTHRPGWRPQDNITTHCRCHT